MKKRKIDLQLFAEGTTGEGNFGGNDAEIQAAEDNIPEVAAQETAEERLATDTASTENVDEEFNELINGKFKKAYENKLKSHISERTKGVKAKETELKTLRSMADVLKSRYGKSDLNELAQAVEEDALYIQQQSMLTGEKEDTILERIRSERQRRIELEERGREQRELEEMREEKAMRERVSVWKTEADGLKNRYPTLDLKTELKDKDFFELLMRGVGVEAAYIVKHHDEMLNGAVQSTAAEVKKKTLDNVVAGSNRARENGTTSQAAAQSDIDVSSLTEKEVLKILKDVENGRKISF